MTTPSEQQPSAFNDLIAQKSFRKKYGHLLEVITSPQFLELSKLFQDETLRANLLAPSYYFPEDSAAEKPAENAMEHISAVKKFLRSYPAIRFNVINSAQFDEKENSCKALIYIGEISAAKIAKWAKENGVNTKIEIEKFADWPDFQATNVDENLSRRAKLTLEFLLNKHTLDAFNKAIEEKTLEKIMVNEEEVANLSRPSAITAQPRADSQQSSRSANK